MSKLIRHALILTVFILVLSACNLPSNTPATEEPNAVFTAAAQTVQAQLTQSVPFSTPTLPPAFATSTAGSSFPTLALPTSTVSVPASPVCDQARFLKDVSIPDGTVFAPGASFTKTWRMRNDGTCTWSGYTLVFDSGDSMNGSSPTTIGTVASGGEVDVSVTLTAPATVGSYRG